MTYKNQLINGLKQGFLFYAFSTILIAIQFGFYIVGSPILDYMDLEGWAFFVASCVSHASQFALLPYLLGFLVLFCRFPKTARVVQIACGIALCTQLSQLSGLCHLSFPYQWFCTEYGFR